MKDSLVEIIQGLEPKNTKDKETIEALLALLELQKSKDFATEINKFVTLLVENEATAKQNNFKQALRSTNYGLSQNAQVFTFAISDGKMATLLNHFSIASGIHDSISVDLDRSIAQGRMQKSEKAIEASNQFMKMLANLIREMRVSNEAFSKLGYGSKSHREKFKKQNNNQAAKANEQNKQEQAKPAASVKQKAAPKKAAASKAKTTDKAEATVETKTEDEQVVSPVSENTKTEEKAS